MKRAAPDMRTCLAWLLVGLGGLGFGSTSAQNFPARPIRLIVPYGPGGNTDVLARVAAQKLGEILGQPVVVENKPGASALIGIRYAHEQPADGYTLLMGNNATAILPTISSTSAGYVWEDWRTIGSMGTVPMVISVSPALPVRNIADLVAYDKATPGRLNVGQVGGHTQLLTERFKSLVGIKAVDVNYRASAQALTDITGGSIQLFIDGAPTSIALHKGSKIRIIAVAAEQRHPQLPDVPTVKEQGYPRMAASAWYALLVASKAPESVTERLIGGMAKVMADTSVRERMVGTGGDPWLGSVADFAEYVKQDVRQLEEDAKRSGYKLQ